MPAWLSTSLPAPTGNLFPAGSKRRPIASGVTKAVIAGLPFHVIAGLTGNLFSAGSKRRPIRSGVTIAIRSGVTIAIRSGVTKAVLTGPHPPGYSVLMESAGLAFEACRACITTESTAISRDISAVAMKISGLSPIR